MQTVTKSPSESWPSLYCDGACRGNPGPAGIGAVLLDKEGGALWKISQRIGQATNNISEYRALIAGIRKSIDGGHLQLHIHMDSELVIRQLSGAYRVRKAHIRPLFAETQKLLKALKAYTLRHIPREKNSYADSLANAALDSHRS